MKTSLRKFLKTTGIVLLFVAALAACKNSGKDDPQPTPSTPTPTITSITPKNPNVGDVVTITGTNFGSTATDVKVTIGSQQITISSVTNTEIKFTMPSGISAGALAVLIKNIAATNNDPAGATITPQTPVVPATITAINPTSGKVGDVITVTGTNFSTTVTENVFKFNGITATVKTATATQLTVEVPTGATTGAVSVSVKSAAAVSGPSFTVNTTTTGTSVDYIQASAGTATFSKIATASANITYMATDRRNNILYYVAGGLVYKMPLSTGTAALLTSDTKVAAITNITTDGSGNVYAHTGGTAISVFKITPDGTATQLATNATFVDNDRSFFVDASSKVWTKHTTYIDNGAAVNTNNDFGLSQANVSLSNGISWSGDLIYIPDGKTITTGTPTYYFYKADLKNRTATKLEYDMATMFKPDDDKVQTTSGNQLNSFRFGLDDSETLYAILPHTYISGQLTKTYMIRKAKIGSASSTLISTFNTKYSATGAFVGPEGYGSDNPIFTVDGAGNMYLVSNFKEIIKISQ